MNWLKRKKKSELGNVEIRDKEAYRIRKRLRGQMNICEECKKVCGEREAAEAQTNMWICRRGYSEYV